MKPFESELLIYFIAATVVIIAGLLLLDKYTNYCARVGWSKKTYIIFILILSVSTYPSLIYKIKEHLTEIKSVYIAPTQGRAWVEEHLPYGITLNLTDDENTSYQFDLEDTDLTNEFIEKVNSGGTISKRENDTELLLVNGNDSVYYNIYY